MIPPPPDPQPAAEPPKLTVIMPAFRGRSVLPRSLGALRASEIPAQEWELVVVDDGSRDGTAELAREWADLVLSVEDGPRGPAHARNLGATVARAAILVFIDADVRVHPDTLRRFRDAFQDDAALGAVFGAYCEDPAEPGFFSQYRNLLHRYHHLVGAGDADTFWAGCGAVRSDVFQSVGGYDARAFPRPQIEDIEMGYRIRDAGHRIVLRPEIEAGHLKHWTFGGIVRTDLWDRGVPWMRLLLQRGPRPGPEGLNIRTIEKVKTGLLGVAALLILGGLVFTAHAPLAVGGAALASVIALNYPLYRWFAGQRGWGFALRVVPMSLLYHLLSGIAVVLGWILHARERIRGAGRARVPP